jgi:tetratricopeptide (TPR) repeat protein
MSDEWSINNVIAAVAAAAAVGGVVLAIINNKKKPEGNSQNHAPVFNNKGAAVYAPDNKGSISVGLSEEEVRRLITETYEHAKVETQALFEGQSSGSSEEVISAFESGDFSKAIALRESLAQEASEHIEKEEKNQLELGNLYFLQKDYVKAKLCYLRARELSGDNSYMEELVKTLFITKESEEAEQLLLKELEDTRLACEELGSDVMLAFALCRFLNWMIAIGGLAEAEKYIEQYLPYIKSSDAKKMLEDPINQILALSGKDSGGAEERLSRLQDVWGKYSYACIEPANSLAQGYDAQERWEEAESLYVYILEICKSIGDEVDEQTSGTVKINFAFNQLAQEKIGKVEELIDGAIDSLGLSHVWIQNIVPKVAQELLDLDELQLAKKYLLIHIDILKLERGNKKDIKYVTQLIEQVDES